MQWEYLLVQDFHSEVVKIVYPDGNLQEWTKPRNSAGSIFQSQILKKIGDDGWEMVGKEGAWLFFKRPKP